MTNVILNRTVDLSAETTHSSETTSHFNSGDGPAYRNAVMSNVRNLLALPIISDVCIISLTVFCAGVAIVSLASLLKPSKDSANQSMWEAIRSAYIPKLNKALQHGAAANAVDVDSGETPLIAAQKRMSLSSVYEMSVALLNAGAKESINAQDREGNTALSLALKEADIKTVELLIENGATFDLQEAIRVAATHQQGALLQYLLKIESNVLQTSQVVKTVMDDALEKGDIVLIGPLSQHGAIFNHSKALWEAVKRGQMEVITCLVQKAGVNINEKNENGKTVMDYALEMEAVELIDTLSKNGAAFDARVALARVVDYRQKAFLIGLVEKGLIAPNQMMSYALMWLDVELIELAHQKGVAIDREVLMRFLGAIEPPYKLDTAQIDFLKCLIKNGANINEKNRYGQTPLLEFLLWPKGDYSIIDLLSLLLENGARESIDAVDQVGKTAMDYALARMHINLVELLYGNGAAITFTKAIEDTIAIKDKKAKALEGSITIENRITIDQALALAKWFIEFLRKKEQEENKIAATIDEIDVAGRTVLMKAVLERSAWGSLKTSIGKISILLRNGARKSIDTVDQSGKAAIDYALEIGDVELVKLLCKNGAKLDLDKIISHSGYLTPQSEIISYLALEGRADTTPVNSKGQTVLMRAIAQRLPIETVFVLLENGAKSNIDAADEEGRAAIDYALEMGDVTLIKLLFNNGAMLDLDKVLSHPGYFTPQAEVVSYLVTEKSADTKAVDGEGRTILMRALKRGLPTETIHLLLENGARESIDAVDEDGRTAMDYALEVGDVELIKLLLSNGATLDLDRALLHHLVLYSVETVQYLVVEQGVNTKAVNEEGQTVLMRAIRQGSSIEIIRCLLENGAKESIDVVDREGGTAINYALNKGDIESIKLLFKNNAAFDLHKLLSLANSDFKTEIISFLIVEKILHINRVNEEGQTILMQAIQQGSSVDIIRLFLENGAIDSIDTIDQSGKTAMDYAVREGNVELVKLLIDSGATLDLNKAINLALEWGKTEVVKYLIEKNDVNINALDRSGKSLIDHVIASKCDVALIKFLLEKGATLDLDKALFNIRWFTKMEVISYLVVEKGANTRAIDGADQTVLMKVVQQRCSIEVIRFLLERGAKETIHAADQSGKTVIDYALENHDVERVKFLRENGAIIDFSTVLSKIHSESLVRYLVEEGANVNAHDSRGETVVSRAVRNGNLDFVKFLYRYGADLKKTHGEKGASLLIIAVQQADSNMVKYLLKQGVSLSVKDSDGNTALMIAERKQNQPLITLLKGEWASLSDG